MTIAPVSDIIKSSIHELKSSSKKVLHKSFPGMQTKVSTYKVSRDGEIVNYKVQLPIEGITFYETLSALAGVSSNHNVRLDIVANNLSKPFGDINIREVCQLDVSIDDRRNLYGNAVLRLGARFIGADISEFTNEAFTNAKKLAKELPTRLSPSEITYPIFGKNGYAQVSYPAYVTTGYYDAGSFVSSPCLPLKNLSVAASINSLNNQDVVDILTEAWGLDHWHYVDFGSINKEKTPPLKIGVCHNGPELIFNGSSTGFMHNRLPNNPVIQGQCLRGGGSTNKMHVLDEIVESLYERFRKIETSPETNCDCHAT